MLQTILAQQTQYTLAYALIFLVVMLGFLVVCVPRPRKKVFRTADEERDAKRSAESSKIRAKKKKQKDKRNKKRNKARKKAMKKNQG